MRFMSMVKSSEDHRLGPPPQALMEAMDKLGQEMTKAGVMVDMGGLLPTAMGAYRVRLSRGKLSVTDGPFSEAKEVIGGYAVFDVQDEGGSHGADHASSWTSTGSTGPSGKARPRSGSCSKGPAAPTVSRLVAWKYHQPCCVVANRHAMIGEAARASQCLPKERIMKMAAHALTTCLWFDTQAEQAANFYVSVFEDAKIGGSRATATKDRRSTASRPGRS